MIFTSAIEASRNWTGALSRFGFGVLFLGALAKSNFLPSDVSFLSLSGAEVSFATLPVLVFWIVLSMIIGDVATMLGTIGYSGKYGEVARTKRAYRVGKTENPLLIEFLRDANSKNDLAAGFFGLLLLFGIVFVVAFLMTMLVGSQQDPAVPQPEVPVASSQLTAFFGALGGLTAYLVRLSATNSIDAIDTVLDTNYPEPPENKSPEETPHG